MCGRYAAARETTAVVEVLTGLGITVGEVTPEALAVTPSFNAPPTRTGLVAVPAGKVSEQVGPDDPDGGPPGMQLAALSWGLVPTWAKDTRGGARMINARVETLADKTAFRSLLRSRRCLVPADGWFEWQAPAGGGRGPKQPFLVHPVDDPLLMFAGLYTWWRDPEAARLDPGTPWFGSYAILTRAADPELAWLHDRMPVALPVVAWPQWLAGGDGPLADDAARHLLDDVLAQPHPGLMWHRVDRRVGAVANDDASLVLPWSEPPE